MKLFAILVALFLVFGQARSQEPPCEEQRQQLLIHAQLINQDRARREGELADALTRLQRLQAENLELKRKLEVVKVKEKKEAKKAGEAEKEKKVKEAK